MIKSFPCYWSDSRTCQKELYEDKTSIFIIGSDHSDRQDYIKIIKKAIIDLDLKPVFALDLKNNNNFDWFCTNICTPIRTSILTVIDLSAPQVDLCDKCNTTFLKESLNVYWEYGYAAGLTKQLILICEEDQVHEKPFDIINKQIQPYNKDNLKKNLQALINAKIRKIINQDKIPELVENAKNQVYNYFMNSHINFTFSFFPIRLIDNLINIDISTLDYLMKNKPKIVSKDIIMFAENNLISEKDQFSINYNQFEFISGSKTFGNSIIIRKEGIIVYNINYSNIFIDDSELVIPLRDILDNFIGCLRYLSFIFKSFNFKGDLRIECIIENIYDFKYYKNEEDPLQGFIESNMQEPYKKTAIFNTRDFHNVDGLISISKEFFNPIFLSYQINTKLFKYFKDILEHQ